MTEQQACTLCDAGGHTAAQCNWNKAEGAQGEREALSAYCAWYRDVFGSAPFHAQESQEFAAFQAGATWQARAALAQPSPAPELEAPTAVGALILGGAFSSTELSDNDVTLDSQAIERLQRELVKDSESIAVELMLVGQHYRILQALRAERDCALAAVVQLYSMLGVTDQVQAGERLGFLVGQSIIVPKLEGRLAELSRETLALCDAVENKGDLPPVKFALRAGRAVNIVRDLIAGADYAPQAWMDIKDERRRQVAMGWTPEHDDEHACDEIAGLACFYAMPPAARDWNATSTGYGDTLGCAMLPDGWSAKTGDRRRELIKAGALIMAEVERLDRVTALEDQ